MSLDIASHPGRTGTDDLVPSSYALGVGEINVLVISDGVFPLQAATLATNADPADLAAWLHEWTASEWLCSGLPCSSKILRTAGTVSWRARSPLPAAL